MSYPKWRVTFERMAVILKRLEALERAGDPSLMPPMRPAAILWTKHEDDREEWEMLPLWIAELVLLDLPYQVKRAIIYRKLPAHAPDHIVRAWAWEHLADYKVPLSVGG